MPVKRLPIRKMQEVLRVNGDIQVFAICADFDLLDSFAHKKDFEYLANKGGLANRRATNWSLIFTYSTIQDGPPANRRSALIL